MKQEFIKQTDIEECILKNYEDIEREKEQKFVDLMIEIIVSLTLNKRKYNSIYKEVILLGKEKYLIYFKRK